MATYVEIVIAKVNSNRDNLWEHLDVVPSLPVDVGRSLLTYFIGLACQAQNAANIQLGRKGILAIPRDWILSNIESVAVDKLDLNDEWEYLRLLELFALLDARLLTSLISLGLQSANLEIVEAATDFRDVTRAE